MRLVFLEELVLLVAFLAVAVEPMPYIVLKNKAAKCYQVDAKSNTKLIVKYHAPGKFSISKRISNYWMLSSRCSVVVKITLITSVDTMPSRASRLFLFDILNRHGNHP